MPRDTDLPPASKSEAPPAELFQALLEHAPVVTYAVHMDGGVGTLIYVSPQSQDVLGISAETLLAEPWEARLLRFHPDDIETLILATGGANLGGFYEGMSRYRHPDGRILHLMTISRPMPSTPAASELRMGFIVDITAELQIPQAVLDSEARYRALVERVPAVVYIDSHDPEPTTNYVSPGVVKLLGYSREEWMKDPSFWPRSIHPDDRARVAESWRESVRSGEDFRLEYRYIHRDGRVVWVRDSSTLIHDEAGEPKYWQGVIQDISDQKVADLALRDSELRFRTLVEQIPAIVYEMGPDDERRTIYVSPHVEHILGYSRNEWLDQPDIWIELLHPEDREHELAALDRHNQTGEPWSRTYRLIADDGRTVWVRDQAVLARDPHRPRSRGTWHGVMLDITSQKAAEEDLQIANELLEYRVRERTAELQEANELMALQIAERERADAGRDRAEERYRSLVEQIPAVVYLSTVTQDGPVIADYSSPQVEDMLGYTPEEWKVQSLWVSRLHPHDRERVLAAWEYSKATGEPFSEEFRTLAKDGRIVWVFDETRLLSRNASGRPERFQGVMMDITALKEAEAAAREAETRYETLAARGPVMSYVIEVDPDVGVRHRYVSPQIDRLIDHPPNTWQGGEHGWLSIVHPDDRDRVEMVGVQAGFTGEGWSMDYRVITKSGEVRWLHDEASLLSRDKEGRPHRFHGVYVDITDQKVLEDELRSSEAQYRTLLEQLPGIPWTEEVDTVTGTSRMTYLGPQTEAIFGWAVEELDEAFRNHGELIHPDDRERVIDANRLANDGVTWDETYRVVARDGTVHTVRSVGRCVSEPGARVQLWNGITIEVPPVRISDASASEDADVSPSA